MLPGWGLVESARQHPTRDLMANYAYLDASALDLASRLLQLDPKKRITSIEALSHPWFSANPLPCLPRYALFLLFFRFFAFLLSFVPSPFLFPSLPLFPSLIYCSVYFPIYGRTEKSHHPNPDHLRPQTSTEV